jgi:hypothetical protein
MSLVNYMYHYPRVMQVASDATSGGIKGVEQRRRGGPTIVLTEARTVYATRGAHVMSQKYAISFAQFFCISIHGINQEFINVDST